MFMVVAAPFPLSAVLSCLIVSCCVWLTVDSKPVVSPMVLLQITIWKLSGSNYLQWSKAVKIFLTSQGEQCHLTKNATKSDDNN